MLGYVCNSSTCDSLPGILINCQLLIGGGDGKSTIRFTGSRNLVPGTVKKSWASKQGQDEDGNFEAVFFPSGTFDSRALVRQVRRCQSDNCQKHKFTVLLRELSVLQ